MNVKHSSSDVHKDGSRVANTNKASLKKSIVPNMPEPKASTLLNPTTGQIFKNQNGNWSPRTDSATRAKRHKKLLRLCDMMTAMYPGIKIGHKDCVQKPKLVPKTMGWLWNTEDTASGVPFSRGYRPGAIALGVKKGKMLKPRSVSEMPNTPIGSKGRKTRRKIKTASSTVSRLGSQSLEILTKEDRSPTLYVRKEGGVYRVMMQPIKDPGAEEDVEVEQPVQIKIAEDSARSSTGHSKSSSSSLKIEYICSGSLRKQQDKPALTEIGIQYDTADLTKKVQEKQVKIKETNEIKAGKKVKK